MTSFPVNESINRLFLVCPTDGMEPLIRKEFEGEAFFYTALGACFEFDIQTENSLWEMILDNDIRQIVFLSSTSNVFYQDAFSKQQKRDYPIDVALAKTRKSIFHHKSFTPNVHLLAANHLKSQKKTVCFQLTI